MLALPIFPVRLQTSIFGASELNFRVRDGNGWTLALINTNYFVDPPGALLRPQWDSGAPSGIRTRDPLIKSQLLYQLS